MNGFSHLRASWRAQSAAFFLCFFLLNCVPAGAQHGHIFAGAVSQSVGSELFFANGNLWATNSYGGEAEAPACLFLNDNLPETYPGQYQTVATFAALAATVFNAGPSPNAAVLGSFLELQFVSLQGPAAGSLTVWDERDDPNQPTLLFTAPVGSNIGTNRINLSEGDPLDPASDPYGHIHGRRFVLDKPGLYTVGLQLLDTSSNGPEGGPIHAPSPVTYFYLQAGLVLSDFSVTNQVARARFGLPGSQDYIVEASPVLPATTWTTITNIAGTTHSELRWFSDADTAAPARFYRVRPATN